MRFATQLSNDYGNAIRQARCQKLFLFSQAVAHQKKKAELFYKERLLVYNYVMQKTKITNKFENDICYVKLKADGKTQYITVKYQNGFVTSPHGYVQPSEFNISEEVPPLQARISQQERRGVLELNSVKIDRMD